MKLYLLLMCCLGMIAPGLARAATADTVVILHGLGRTRWSMARLASGLERDGYRVVNLSYPSRTLAIESLATTWLPEQLRANGVEAASHLHFVTHSMGGIIVRLWLRDCGAPANLGRLVMLAPPNAGSEVSDHLNGFAPFRWFTGANGRRLGTGATDLPRTLGPWPFASAPSAKVQAPANAMTEVPAKAGLPAGGLAKAGDLGIIAGSFSWNPLFSAWLPGPDDGKVTVAATHLAGERDHLVLRHSHTWLAWHADTLAQTRAFLRTGRFLPPDPLSSIK